MKEIQSKNKPFYKRKRFYIGILSVLLIVALLVSALVLLLTAAPAVYGFGGATLREDAYSYWFACMKYKYHSDYSSLGIEDTAEGWAKTDEDGRTYEESFYTLIDEEIRLRFVAASLFDSQGYTLSKADRVALDTLIADFDTETFGEVPFDRLEKTYGISRNAVKQTALYEQKYTALYKQLFSDPSVVYSSTYREALDTFYKTYYYRYNMIYLPDSVGATAITALESILWEGKDIGVSCVTGITEERFTELEAEYTDENSKVTSGKYPNGIYLYAGESYRNAFSAELLSAFAEADEIGKVVKKRNADDNGTYYVMRYALDEKPYLSEDKRVTDCFKNLPNYAGAYLYRSLLRKELSKIVSHGIAEGYTVAGTVSCKDYNMVNLIGG